VIDTKDHQSIFIFTSKTQPISTMSERLRK